MTSPLLAAAAALERRAGTLTIRSRLDWAAINRRAKGHAFEWLPLDFERWPFQRALYEDNASEIVVRKATQMGASEWGLSDALYVCDELGRTALYVLPSKEPDANNFSADRIAPAIRNSPLAGRSRDVDNVGLRHIGPGSLYVRGSNKETHLSSVPCDCVIVDEHDLCVTANLPAAERRVGASPLGWKRWIGVPYVPDRGIDRRFLESDRRRWTVTCPSCSHEQWLTWAANVVVEEDGTAFRACARCGEELLPGDIAAGRWVAEYPDREVHGYAMSKLIRPDLDLQLLVKASKATAAGEVEAFWRYDLGEPYTAPGARLTREDIARAITRGVQAGLTEARFGDLPPMDYAPDARLVVGVDVGGSYLRVWIDQLLAGRATACRWAGTLKDRDGFDAFAQLGVLLHQLPVSRCVIDSLPEERKTRELCTLFPGRVYRCTYNVNPEAKGDIEVDERASMVRVKRTESLDATFDAVRSGDRLWPPAVEAVKGAVDELCEPVRVVTTDARGRPVARYAGDGADHLAHALNYARAAAHVAGHGFGPILEVV